MPSEIHMGGMLSGTDTQGIIDKLLALEVDKITAVQEEKTELEEDIAAWSELSTEMTALTESLDTLRSGTTWDMLTGTASDTASLSALANSTAVETTYDFTISKLAKAHSVASDKASVLTVTPSHDSSTDLVNEGVLTAGHAFTIEGETITIAADESLDSLMAQINTAADSMAEADKVSASIIDNQLVITRDNTGNTDITMSNDGVDTALTDLGILTAPATYKNVLSISQDAEFTVNNISVVRSDNDNLTDVINGVTLNLLDEDTSGDLTLTISRNTTVAKATIVDFVEKYNSVIEKMESYAEVTITGSDQTTTGVLQDDPLVKALMGKLRKLATEQKSQYMTAANASYTYNSNTGVADSLSDIGVWTTGKQNRLELVDEERLDYMLANNGDEVEQMFRGVYDGDSYEHGVAKDLYDYSYGVSTSLTGQIALRQARIEERSVEKEDLIEKMFNELDDYEQNLWVKFGVMEDAMARMQQELSWLTAQIG